ncbi:antitoxin [Streptomyces sp. NPDC058855]|uniref:antitoxin n=1 Tax=Streptomyces sp. NPDC058855 TaxID=3346651 RepID=UPI0036B9EB2B
MGLLDSLKAKLAPAKDKVADLAHQHGDKIDHGIDKAARMVDERTKGKYSDKIQSGTGKAKDALDRIGHKDDGTGGTPGPGGTPGTGGTPGSGGPTTPPAA